MRTYFAYGSNMWKRQMMDRCPDNCFVSQGILHEHRWIISSRGYANIVRSPTDIVYGGVYKITSSDEFRLDKYEGVNSGAYYKKELIIYIDSQPIECLVYIDPTITEGLPRANYINYINHGIVDMNLPDDYVNTYIRKFVPIDSSIYK